MNFKTLDSESFSNSTKSSPDTGGDPKLQSGAARLEPVLKQPTKTTVGLNSTKETSSYSEPSEDRAVQHQTFLQEDGSRDVQNGEEVEVEEQMQLEEPSIDNNQPIAQNIEKAQETAFEDTTNLGLIFNIFHLCLTQRQAVFGVIFLAFILNASDAFSDYSLAFYLYNTGFHTAASLILLIDYGVFFISLSHYLMNHMATASWLTLALNSLFLILLHPFTPGLSALYWLIIRARGVQREDTAHYFLKMTSVIQGCAEAPSQIVATSWMILTNQLEAPWTKQSEVCDSWGNCVALGVVLSVGSLALSWISLLKASLDSFQSADVLSAICLLLPSLMFRLGSTILIFTFLEVRKSLFNRMQHVLFWCPPRYTSFDLV